MKKSIVKQNFINWCQMLHPDISPNIFLDRHARYYDEYLPLLDKLMVQMHNYLSERHPNTNFFLKGRIKSERSYLIKSYISMCENIEKIFNADRKEEERDKNFEKYFKFLLTEDPERFDELKKQTKAITPAFDYTDSFLIIFNKLSKDEKDKLVSRLGRTEDTFAYRLIVKSVEFPITSIMASSASEFYITDPDGNVVPIKKAITLNPEKDIIYSEEFNKHYIIVDGKKQYLNERNLLYPHNIPLQEHTLANAQKDEDGNLTLLTDSLIIGNKCSDFNIVDIQQNPKNNCIFVTDSRGNVKNLSALLQEEPVKLKKYDEEALIGEVYNLYHSVQDLYKESSIQSIWSRFKDYIKTPKPDTEYMSLHDSAVNKKHGFTIEGQSRTLQMEDDCKDESIRVGHDAYKQEKLKKYRSNKFLNKILSKDPTAFDSSTPVLMKILESENIKLSEVLGKYILTTSVANGKAVTYQPPIDVVFEHTFQNTKSPSKDSQDDDTPSLDSSNDGDIPKLDFSNYENFIISKRLRYNALKKEQDFPDIYDD